MPLRYFTILGERCTGTHFLQYAILKNFSGLEYKKGEKHFFGNRECRDSLTLDTFDKWSLHEKQMKELDAIPPDEVLVISLVRHPIDWIDSFFKRQHHVPSENRESIEQFIQNEWYSIYEEAPRTNEEIMEDRNWRTKERYRDIFELRKEKVAYMLDHQPPHCIIRYEDLRDDYTATLDRLQQQFGLSRYNMAAYEPVPKYKGTFNALYEKKPILLTLEIQKYIWEKVDQDQESRLGYQPETS